MFFCRLSTLKSLWITILFCFSLKWGKEYFIHNYVKKCYRSLHMPFFNLLQIGHPLCNRVKAEGNKVLTLSWRCDICASWIGQDLPISHNTNTNLVGTTLKANHDGHCGSKTNWKQWDPIQHFSVHVTSEDAICYPNYIPKTIYFYSILHR